MDGGAWERGALGMSPVGFGGGIAWEGRAVLLSSASGFSVAVAGERKIQRSLLPRERLLAPFFPLEVEAGEAD